MKMYETYLAQIQRYKLLTAEEEKEIAENISRGSKAAVTKLVNSNLRLVVSVANKFKKAYRVSVMDLIQEGNMGLMAAAEKFSAHFKTRFSTYAYPWILQYMLRFVHNKSTIISIPQRKEEVLRKISNLKNEYSQVTGREASIEEMARSLGISEKEVKEVLDCLYSYTSLDCECGEEGSSTIGDLIPDFTYSPEENFFIEIARTNIQKLIEGLSEKERYIIQGRFNFDGKIHAPTLRELGISLGVSAETVRQTEIKALKKIKSAVDKDHLEMYTA